MGTPSNEMCEKCQYRIEAQKTKAPDLGQILKLAMMVSKMFGQQNDSGSSSKPGITQQPIKKNDVGPSSVFTMDSLIEDKKIRIIKASLPYLDPTYQQLMHFLAKCLELKNIIDPDLYFEKTASMSGQNRSPVGMLGAIKPHLEPKEQTATDIACKAFEIVELFRLMDAFKRISDTDEEKEPKESEVSKETPPDFENII